MSELIADVARRWVEDYKTLQDKHPTLDLPSLLYRARTYQMPQAHEPLTLRDTVRDMVRDEALPIQTIADRLRLSGQWHETYITPDTLLDNILKRGNDFVWGPIAGEMHYRARTRDTVLGEIPGSTPIDEFKLGLVESMGSRAMTMAEIIQLPDLPPPPFAHQGKPLINWLPQWIDFQSGTFARLRSKTPVRFYVSIGGLEWAKRARERINEAMRPAVDTRGYAPLSPELEALIDHEPNLARAVYRAMSPGGRVLSVRSIADIMEENLWMPAQPGPVWTLIDGVLAGNRRLFEAVGAGKGRSWRLRPLLDNEAEDETRPFLYHRMTMGMGKDVLTAQEILDRLRKERMMEGRYSVRYIKGWLRKYPDRFEEIPGEGTETYFQVKGG